MNTQLMTRPAVASRSRARRAEVKAPSPQACLAEAAKPRRPGLELRHATAADAQALHTLIEAHIEEGHLLPRSLVELSVHAPRFVVAVHGRSRRAGSKRRIVGCAELAPLSGSVAEVRSLVVDRAARGLGLGRRLVEQLRRQARLEGFEKLCAFTHDAGYFVRKGFSIVPHVWVPEKIARDCHQCALFRRCGQHAVVLSLARSGRPQPADGVPSEAE